MDATEWKKHAKKLEYIHEYWLESKNDNYFIAYRTLLEAAVEASETIKVKISCPSIYSSGKGINQRDALARIEAYPKDSPSYSEYSMRDLANSLYQASKTQETYDNSPVEGEPTGLILHYSKNEKENLAEILVKLNRYLADTLDEIEFQAEGFYYCTSPVSSERPAVEAIFIDKNFSSKIDHLNESLEPVSSKLVRKN